MRFNWCSTQQIPKNLRLFLFKKYTYWQSISSTGLTIKPPELALVFNAFPQRGQWSLWSPSRPCPSQIDLQMTSQSRDGQVRASCSLWPQISWVFCPLVSQALRTQLTFCGSSEVPLCFVTKKGNVFYKKTPYTPLENKATQKSLFIFESPTGTFQLPSLLNMES